MKKRKSKKGEEFFGEKQEEKKGKRKKLKGKDRRKGKERESERKEGRKKDEKAEWMDICSAVNVELVVLCIFPVHCTW